MLEGALARITETHDGLDNRTYYKDMTFTVDEFITAEEAEDGVAFYWGSSGYGFGDVAVEASKVEQVMSADEAKAREVPSLAEVTEFLAGAAVSYGESDTFRVDGAEYFDKERGVFSVEGKADNHCFDWETGDAAATAAHHSATEPSACRHTGLRHRCPTAARSRT